MSPVRTDADGSDAAPALGLLRAADRSSLRVQQGVGAVVRVDDAMEILREFESLHHVIRPTTRHAFRGRTHVAQHVGAANAA